MAIKQLNSQEVQPDVNYIVNNSDIKTNLYSDGLTNLLSWQPRVAAAVSLLCKDNNAHYRSRFMLLKGSESELFFDLLQQSVKINLASSDLGYSYYFSDNKITLTKAKSKQDNFAVQDSCLSATIVDMEKLFGCVRQPENSSIKLQAGLVHHANGGVLILGLRSLLAQPIIWAKLKQMVLSRTFEWFSADDSHPLPLSIPSIPLDLRIILVGDRQSLAELQDFEPEFYSSSIYAEFENEMHITESSRINDWMNYLQFISKRMALPQIDHSAFAKIYKYATRYTGDQYYLPLSIEWVPNGFMMSFLPIKF